MGDIPRREIGRERPLVALAGIAVPAAARRGERDRVAGAEDVLPLRIGPLAVDAQLARRARLAAFDAGGGEDGALRQEGDGDRRLAPALDQDLLPEPAPVPPRPAAVRPEPLVPETQGRDVL